MAVTKHHGLAQARVAGVFDQRLTGNLRDSDKCFRHDGEAFMVLLPNTGLENA